MRKLFILILAIAISTQLIAQGSFRKNMVYGQLAGNGLFLSANYERQLGKKPGLGLYIGAGYISESDDDKFRPVIPVGVTYLFDLGNEKSFIEAGAGVTMAEADVWDDEETNTNKSHAYEPAFIPSIGYRHHTPYGLMWKINYTPIFTSYRNILWMPGISVGWRW